MSTLELDRLRELARRYLAICHEPVQQERRRLWRQHNSLKPTRPLIYTRAWAWHEMPESKTTLSDPLCRSYEEFFQRHLFWHSLNDDSIFEPWITVSAVKTCHGWGVPIERHRTGDQGGSYKVNYPIKELSDLAKLRPPVHQIDEAKTAELLERVQAGLGDLITVNLDRGPAYRMWAADLSTDIGHLRGIENLMVDMVDNPEWFHELLGFLSRGVCQVHAAAEAAGDWSLSCHQNQAMPYAEELPDPAANVQGVKRSQLWTFLAAQEFTGVSPAMHEEFLLRWQLPIMAPYGLVAYGCCEDLTHKIAMLRKIPRLRRIAVSPFAKVAQCAEQIGRDFVFSYRPSPSDMVGYGWDPERARQHLRRDLNACRDCCVDITLKDVETVQGDPQRVREWVKVTRGVIGEIWKE